MHLLKFMDRFFNGTDVERILDREPKNLILLDLINRKRSVMCVNGKLYRFEVTELDASKLTEKSGEDSAR